MVITKPAGSTGGHPVRTLWSQHMYDARTLAMIDHQIDLIAAAANRVPGSDPARLTVFLYLLAEDLVGRDHAPDRAMKARIHDLIDRLATRPAPGVPTRHHEG